MSQGSPNSVSHLLSTCMRKTALPRRSSPQIQGRPLIGPAWSRARPRGSANAGSGLSPFGSWAKKGHDQLTAPSQNEFPAGKGGVATRGGGLGADEPGRYRPQKPRFLNPLAAAGASASWSDKLRGEKSSVVGVRWVWAQNCDFFFYIIYSFF